MATGWVVNALLSALLAGITAVLAKAGLAGVNADLATLIRTAFVLMFMLVVYVALHGLPRGFALGARAYWFLAASAAAAALSWLFYYRAIQGGPVAGVSAIDRSSLIVAAVAAAIFLGERLTPRMLIGAVLVVAGVMLMTLKGR
jgi:bacterial/archaeal transporter family protein